MSISLYELTNEFLQVKPQLEQLDLENDVLRDTLDSLQMPIEEKAENIIKYVRSLEAEAKAFKEEAKRMEDRAAATTKKAASLLAYLDINLKRANIEKLNAGVFKVSFRKGSESVKISEDIELPKEILDENGFPIRLFEPQPDKLISKTELKQILKEGYEIPGVAIVRGEDTLQIK